MQARPLASFASRRNPPCDRASSRLLECSWKEGHPARQHSQADGGAAPFADEVVLQDAVRLVQRAIEAALHGERFAKPDANEREPDGAE
jgi:hypothetical protein